MVMYVYTPVTRKTIGSDTRFNLQSLHEPPNLFSRIHRVSYISPECQTAKLADPLLGTRENLT